MPNVPEFLSAYVTQDYELNLIVGLHQGYRDLELKELIGPDLVIEFGKVRAFMVHEEFSHLIHGMTIQSHYFNMRGYHGLILDLSSA